MSRWEDLGRHALYDSRKLAALCGVSLRTLQRHFASRYRTSPHEWLKSLRLDDAYSRLARGEPVKNVAYSLGFKQLSHFSRTFKEQFGVAPREIAYSRRSSALEFEPISRRAVFDGNDRISEPRLERAPLRAPALFEG